MTTQFDDVATRIETATDYYGYFGPAQQNPADHVKRTYRSNARVVYPDFHMGTDRHERAEDAFKRLTELYDQALEAARRSEYGEPITLMTWTTKRAVHQVLRSTGHGDLCATYTSTTRPTKGSSQRASFCKVAMNAADNDLLQVEATVLKRLRGSDSKAELHPYYPELLDSFEYREAGKPTRRVNVLPNLEGFYNLAQVRRAFPEGLEAVHMVWIWRRILWALSHAHDMHVVHGAILPQHVMVLPEQHGVVVVDWCYASVTDDAAVFEPIKAIVGAYKNWYPEEVFAKQAPSSATDLVMAARCMIELTGGDPLSGNYPTTNHTPRAFRAFFRGCLTTNQRMRPQDAIWLLSEFDQLLQDLGQPYYPRKFRKFVMPTSV